MRFELHFSFSILGCLLFCDLAVASSENHDRSQDEREKKKINRSTILHITNDSEWFVSSFSFMIFVWWKDLIFLWGAIAGISISTQAEEETLLSVKCNWTLHERFYVLKPIGRETIRNILKWKKKEYNNKQTNKWFGIKITMPHTNHGNTREKQSLEKKWIWIVCDCCWFCYMPKQKQHESKRKK